MPDIGKFMRLRRAIQSTVEGLDDDQAAMAGEALARHYVRLRKEVAAVVSPQEEEEFARLFPEAANGYGRAPMEQAKKFHAAKGLLAQLGGWLQGFIDEAELQARAEVYARERVKQKRGVGFKPDA
jgi:hypothetical protein